MEKFYQSLLELNFYETLGQKYYETHGRELSMEQYGYLLRHGHSHHLMENLNSPKALEEQKQLRENILQNYGIRGLSSQKYLPKEKDFEIEQLLRYVDIPRHRHDFVELVCVLSGQCKHIINGEHYVNHKGDFTVIPPTVEHELHASPDCVCLTAKFRNTAFVEIFPPVRLRVVKSGNKKITK